MIQVVITSGRKLLQATGTDMRFNPVMRRGRRMK